MGFSRKHFSPALASVSRLFFSNARSIQLGIILLGAGVDGAGAQTFEAGAGYAEGAAVEDLAGWTASAPGLGRVTGEAAVSGAQSLAIIQQTEGDFVEFSYVPAGDGINFVDFWIRPAVETEPKVAVEVDGAMIGFVGSGNGTGEVVGVVPAANGDLQAQGTGREIAVDAAGKATEWVRLTVRRDRGQQKWDLFVNGELALINLPTQNLLAPAAKLRFSGAPAAVYVDDVTVGATNVLYPDFDRDGLPDLYEKTFGLNFQANNRLADKDLDGRTDLEEFLLGSRPDVPEGQPAGGVIYVDNSCGSDANSGRFPLAGAEGPKASISAAVENASPKDIVMVRFGLGTYLEEGGLKFSAPVTLRFEDATTVIKFRQND